MLSYENHILQNRLWIDLFCKMCEGTRGAGSQNILLEELPSRLKLFISIGCTLVKLVHEYIQKSHESHSFDYDF